MDIKIPDYKKAIDAINRLLVSGRVQGNLEQQLRHEAAGLVAEQQMAYQLTSYFQNSDELYVYNNLAIQNGEIIAQIDHLVFSRRAIYFIESKSVAGTIHVNNAGEFQRQYGRKSTSIKSPIEQVKRQKVVLIDFLKAHKDKFMGKFLFMQKGVNSWTPHYYVAISEKGKIMGPGRDQFIELMKFDQVASEIVEHHKKTDIGFLKSLDDKSGETLNLLNKEEISRVIEFIEESDVSQSPLEKIKELINKPEYRKDILPSPKQASQSSTSKIKSGALDGFVCRKCGSHNLKIAFGRSYYFKCNDCDGNTSIKLTCEKCSGPMRTRKQKEKFYKICKQCGIDELYYINQ